MNVSSISDFINSQKEALAIALKTWQPQKVPEEPRFDDLCSEDDEVFNEEFVVDNLACTCKIKTIVEGKKGLSWCLQKSTANKEVYIMRFRGTWADLKWTLEQMCRMGLTFNRNVHFYDSNTTRLLAVDIDGNKNDKYGITSFAADALIAKGIVNSGVLVIPSSRCNYTGIYPDERKIKKYHVFVYTKPYDCTQKKEIDRLTDEFISSVNISAKDSFPWDRSARSPWLRFFSKSSISAEQVMAGIPTINIRFRTKTDAIFEYRNFEQIFKKPFLFLEKCGNYVPNKNRTTDKNAVQYSIPPIGESNEQLDPNRFNKKKKEKKEYRNFDKELKDFAGLSKPGIYKMPHYIVGRMNIIHVSMRNEMATKIMWGIVFNVYSAERFCGMKMPNREQFVIDWFHSVFNASNVENCEEFMDGFNPHSEYDRKSKDVGELERHYDYAWAIDESKFYRTVKIGYGGSFDIDGCETREELESKGMSERTVRRKAKQIGLDRKKRTSKLDQYMDCSDDELNELVKTGVLNRMDKSRIIARRKTDDCV